MHFPTILALGLFHLVIAGPVKFEPTFAHFSTEAANKGAPSFDLSPWGYSNTGGALPRAYDLSSGANLTYVPEKSWERFLEIKAGRFNASATTLAASPAGGLAERGCDSIHFDMVAFGGCTASYQNTCVTSNTCYANTCNATWQYIYVYSVQSAYITFWTSKACNGDKGSINPHCGSGSTQSCTLNRSFNSLRLYSGCHDQYGNDGCV
ncbi:hypothetical protein VTL71DRAFT_7678 [Oculimacula yallundae]|uniref:Uncharacterized protein n=1 Tax=Oculimacula yallundae TaxID=86028 RepID=A0ABR4BUT2_9HELO